MRKPEYYSNKNGWQILLDKLSQTLVRNERRFELIQTLDREIQRSSNDPDKIFQFILNEGLGEVNADFGHIMIKSGNELEIKYSSQEKVIGHKIPIKESICGKVLEEMKWEFAEDVGKHSQYYLIHPQTRTELAIPIQDFRGIKIFGILNIEWKKKTVISAEDLKFCMLLNGQLAIAMEQIKLWQGVRMISELGSELLNYAKSREQVYDLILKKILSILDFDLGQILLVDNNNKLVIVASSNPDDLSVVLDGETSVCGYYIFNEKGVIPLNIPDIATSPYKNRYRWILGKENEEKMGSEFVVPLIGSENNTIGVINIEDPRIAAFSEFDEFIINIFGKMIASTVEASNSREIIRNIKSAEDFDFIFASFGHLSINFLHNFGGGINNAKARLAEFKRSIENVKDLLPKFSDETGLEFINGIIVDLKKIEDLIHTFRDKTKPENINQQAKRLELISAIEEAIERAKNKRIQNISFEFIKDASIAKRQSIDSLLTEHFDEILTLLIENAMEAMPSGGKIQVILKLTGLFTAQICIKDNGIGMDRETLKKVFDFGFSTKTNVRVRRGEGIGLWLAKIYLQRFGAQLNADSKLGHGTSFFIHIPIML